MRRQQGHRGWMETAAILPIAMGMALLHGFTTSSGAAQSAIAPQLSSVRSIKPGEKQRDAQTRNKGVATTKLVLASKSTCPTDIESVVAQLILDLPSYSNRAIQRASQLGDKTPLYLIVAGQAVITPISMDEFSNSANSSRLPSDSAQTSRPGKGSSEEIYQIAFTNLERQYLQRRPARSDSLKASPTIEQQQQHWLILARNPAADGSPWRMISLRSQLTPYPAEDQVLAPPRNARPGPIGQGIRIWLRDRHSKINPTSCPIRSLKQK